MTLESGGSHPFIETGPLPMNSIPVEQKLLMQWTKNS